MCEKFGTSGMGVGVIGICVGVGMRVAVGEGNGVKVGGSGVGVGGANRGKQPTVKKETQIVKVRKSFLMSFILNPLSDYRTKLKRLKMQ